MENSLEQIFELIEKQEIEVNDETDIASEIRKSEEEGEGIDFELEELAFNLTVNIENDRDASYFNPKFISKNSLTREIHYWPNTNEIDTQAVDYWKKRLEKSNHPIIKSRYADLIWEFKKLLTEKQFIKTAALQVIDSNLKIVKDAWTIDEDLVKQKLFRAMQISSDLKNEQKIENIKEVIISISENQRA